jgi:imidazolonepropionase-like amidohydrolase
LTDALVVYNARVIDGTGAPPIENAVLRIAGGRLTSIDQGTFDASTANGAQLIDASGKTVVPGLWDAHVHYHEWMAELYLRSGVTSFLDAGNYAEWILAQRDGVALNQIRGPRIFACGSPLGNDPVFAGGGTALQLDGPEDARRKVRRQLDLGVDAVKVWAFADEQEMAAITGEAHRAGRKAVAHLTTSARPAVLAGIDCLAHATGLPMAAVKKDETRAWMEEREQDRIRAIADLRPGASTAWALFAMMEEDTYDELIDFFLEHQTRIEPDFIFRWIFASPHWEEYEAEDLELLESSGLQYVPEYARVRAREAWGLFRRLGPKQREELRVGYQKFISFFNQFVARGGQILTGSDTSSWPMPGLGIPRELGLMVDAGLTPMQALMAATRNPAVFLGKGDTMGTLERGKVADLLIVGGDPLADISVMRRVEVVVKDGRVIDRELHAEFANPIPRPKMGMLHANPAPKITSVSTVVATQGDGDLAIEVEGSGFIRGSLATFDGVSIQTKVAGPQRLTAVIPSYLLGRAGTFAIWIANPKPIRIVDWLHEDERSNPAYFIVRFAS